MSPASTTTTDKRCPHLPIKQILLETMQLLRSEWISECQNLLDILSSAHLQALLFTADAVARGVYDHDYIDLLLAANANTTTTKENVASNKKQANNLIITKRKRKLPAQKLIRVFKSHEPLGVTVRFEEDTGDIILSRVLVGGPAHRSGLVSVGDRILEVNGMTLRGRSHLEVLNILQKECLKTMITFRVMVAARGGGQLDGEMKEPAYIVRAHFDYDPLHDPLMPCHNIGLAFTKGTILTVLDRDDPNWWQACRESADANCPGGGGIRKPRMEIFQLAGLIPSQQLQERRIASRRTELSRQLTRGRPLHIFGGLVPLPFKKSRWATPKVQRTMYDLNEVVSYDRQEIVTYEPVTKYLPKAHSYRPVVLTGPANVGCTTLIRMLANTHCDRYREPLAYTTRFKRYAETDGVDFHFTNETWMMQEIRANNFVCYSKYKGNWYGLHRSTIQKIIDDGYVAIFKIDAKFLRLITNAQWKPFVVFLTPPADVRQLTESRLKYHNFSQHYRSRARFEYEMQLMIIEAHRLQHAYGSKFDAVVVNDQLHQAFEELSKTLASVENEPKWVPLSWVSKHV